MKKRIIAAGAAACLLLSGCASLLERRYTTVEEHSSKYWEEEAANVLRAESYQDLVNDILLLVGSHTPDARMRLYYFEDTAAVADALERAAAEVKQETPMGAYAVEYITTETQHQRGYDEVDIHIAYRRTQEQVRAVVNATSTAALPNLLDTAVEEGREELAVRVSYWGADETAGIDAMLADARERWGLADAAPWTVSYYPSPERAGIVEFGLPTDPLPEGELTGGENTEGTEPTESVEGKEGPAAETGEAVSPEADATAHTGEKEKS